MAKIRADMDIKLLDKMKKAGCVLLNYGVESGSGSILESMGKPYSAKDAETVIKNTSKAGIDVVLNFIVGYPGETEDDFQKTLDFIGAVSGHVLNIAPGHPCLVVPYNRLYRNPERYNIIVDRKDTRNWMTSDGKNTIEVREKRVQIFNKFLDDSKILIRCGDDDRAVMEKAVK